MKVTLEQIRDTIFSLKIEISGRNIALTAMEKERDNMLEAQVLRDAEDLTPPEVEDGE